MLLKTSFALACMASVVSSTFPVMPKCWRKCAREAGVMCQWTDIPCLCKTANNGLHTKANVCACHTCGDAEFGNDDIAKITLKEFSFACKVAMTPLDQGVFEAAYHAATCPSTAAPSSSPPAPHDYESPSPPDAPHSPPSAPGYGYGSPPPPGSLPPPPPHEPHGPVTSPYASVTVPTSPFLPTSAASLNPEGHSHGIGVGAYDSTQTIQSTVVVIPVPATQNSTSGSHTATHTGATTATTTGTHATATGSQNATKTGAQPTQFTGAAMRRDVTGSVFALAAALAYVIA